VSVSERQDTSSDDHGPGIPNPSASHPISTGYNRKEDFRQGTNLTYDMPSSCPVCGTELKVWTYDIVKDVRETTRSKENVVSFIIIKEVE